MLAYPKFLLLFITLILAYLIFAGRTYPPLTEFILTSGYLGAFIAGALFAYGFTAAPATALLLLISKQQNLVAAGLIAGIGALVADLLIFSFIRVSFADEIRHLSNEKVIKTFNGHIPLRIKKYLLPVFAGFIIASPLPDEVGVTLLAAYKKMSFELFTILSYALNTSGILVILYVGTLL